MSSSAYANLCYGFAEPIDEYGERTPAWEAFDQRMTDEEYSEWAGLRQQTGVELRSFASWSYPRTILLLTASLVRAEWYNFQRIEPAGLLVPPAWDAQLRTFAAATGFDLGDAQPGWWLAPMYG